MNKLILVVAVFIVLYMCGCATTKEICIIDSQGNPLNNCYIFVQQENILYPNSNELFITKQTGTIKFRIMVLFMFMQVKKAILFHLLL